LAPLLAICNAMDRGPSGTENSISREHFCIARNGAGDTRQCSSSAAANMSRGWNASSELIAQSAIWSRNGL
jgi:hypothetical protein